MSNKKIQGKYSPERAKRKFNFKEFFFKHMFDIINVIITILALIVAILSLLLQLSEK